MIIPVTKFSELLNNIEALDELVAATENKVDDGLLASAKTALKVIADNKSLINVALSYLNLPVSFSKSAGEIPVPPDIEGIEELRTVLLACDCDGCDGPCDGGKSCE